MPAVPRSIAVASMVAGWAAVYATALTILLAVGVGGSSAAPARSAGDVELSLVWVGDITPGSRYGRPPGDGRVMFAAARERLRADLTLGNLEGTLSTGGVSKCGTDGGGCFSFQAPPRNAAALRWAGFDLLNLANNHSMDFGPEGRRETVRALRRHGLRWTGGPGEVAFLRVEGVRIAVLGFAPNTGAADLRDIPGAVAAVRRADRTADIVVVLMHAGAEGVAHRHVPRGREHFLGQDRGNTRRFARVVVDAGADLVLGSGPHVLRGMERRRGRLIAYSLANFAGWRNFARSGMLALSGVLRVEIDGSGRLLDGRLHGVRLTGPGIPAAGDEPRAVALVHGLGRADFGPTAVRLRPDGRFRR